VFPFGWKSAEANGLQVASVTEIERALVTEEEQLVAVTVKMDELIACVGVPEITPVLEFKESPVGSAGVTLKVVPVEVGVIGVIACPLSSS
jgi:hypothetical protein